MSSELIVAIVVLAVCSLLSAWILLPVRVTVDRTRTAERLRRLAHHLTVDEGPSCGHCGRVASVLGGTPTSRWLQCAPCGRAWREDPQPAIDPSTLTAAADHRVEHLRQPGYSGRRWSGTGHSSQAIHNAR